jgi:hypothetical protein
MRFLEIQKFFNISKINEVPWQLAKVHPTPKIFLRKQEQKAVPTGTKPGGKKHPAIRKRRVHKIPSLKKYSRGRIKGLRMPLNYSE